MTMRNIFGSIVKHQASGGKWLISEVIVDTVSVYIYCNGDEVDEVFKVNLDQMVEERVGLEKGYQLIKNLVNTHMKIRENKRIKIAKYYEPILEIP